MTKVADLAEGDDLAPFDEGPLTVTDFVRYQGASGDFNPIHHDTEFARSAGFDQPFAVGMRQAGVAASWLTNAFGATAVRRFSLQWREQAWPGDVLSYEGTVTEVRGHGPDREVDVAFTVRRQTGSTHAKGTATLVEPA